MSKPVFSVKYVATESLLPEKLERGRAYFVADEQIIVVDMGDGRGPVRYGDKPGPQGIAGEPLPQLQEQIDNLAAASLQTTINIHNIRAKNKDELQHLQNAINTAMKHTENNAAHIDEQTSYNSDAILSLLDIVHKKFTAYDDAINILAKTVSNLYPYNYGASAGDPSVPIATGEIISDGVNSFVVDSASGNADSGMVVLTMFTTQSESPKVLTLKSGDNVTFDGGSFTVNSVEQNAESGIIEITLHQA